MIALHGSEKTNKNMHARPVYGDVAMLMNTIVVVLKRIKSFPFLAESGLV